MMVPFISIHLSLTNSRSSVTSQNLSVGFRGDGLVTDSEIINLVILVVIYIAR